MTVRSSKRAYRTIPARSRTCCDRRITTSANGCGGRGWQAHSIGPARPLRPIAAIASGGTAARRAAAATAKAPFGRTAATGAAATGTTSRPAATVAPHPSHFLSELEEFVAVELAVAVGIERERPLDEPLGRRRAETTRSSRRTTATRTTTPFAWAALRRAATSLARSPLRRTAALVTGSTFRRATAAVTWSPFGRATALVARAARSTGEVSRRARRWRRPKFVVGQTTVAVGVELEDRLWRVFDFVGVEFLVVVGVERLAEWIGRRTEVAVTRPSGRASGATTKITRLAAGGAPRGPLPLGRLGQRRRHERQANRRDAPHRSQSDRPCHQSRLRREVCVLFPPSTPRSGPRKARNQGSFGGMTFRRVPLEPGRHRGGRLMRPVAAPTIAGARPTLQRPRHAVVAAAAAAAGNSP